MKSRVAVAVSVAKIGCRKHVVAEHGLAAYPGVVATVMPVFVTVLPSKLLYPTRVRVVRSAERESFPYEN